MAAMDALKPFAKMFLNGKWRTGPDRSLRSVLRTEGNLKIPATTAIFNMSSATDCPSRKLGICKAVVNGKSVCYAKRAECSMRPGVLPFRRKQQLYWKRVEPEQFCAELLAISLAKLKPFTALRFNEAGDFHTQSCVDKAEKIARILKIYGIIAYAYSSRDDLDYSKIRALKISGSGFKKPGIVNIFTMIPNIESKPKGFGICCGNCRVCNRCQRAGLKTAIVKH